MGDIKRENILKALNSDSGQTIEKCRNARKVKNNEWYTEYTDIKQELDNYGNHFKGRNIICPCDWDIIEGEPIYSMTIEFEPDADNPIHTINKVKRVTLKKSLFEPEESIEEIVINGKEADAFISKRVTCGFIVYLKNIGKKFGVNSITASGYDVINNRGVRFQSVDYSKYDLCITNPPFSNYGEFMDIMISERDKRVDTDNPFDFIVLSPFLNRANPNVGLNLMLKKCYLGYGRHLNLTFQVPDKGNDFKKKTVGCDWITTFNDAQKIVDATPLNNGIKYDTYKNEYVECTNMTMKDGTHPIRIKNSSCIPEDYYGWMYSSVNALDFLSNDEFEWYGTHFHGYFNRVNPNANPFNHKTFDGMEKIDGEDKYFAGIVFRRKTE